MSADALAGTTSDVGDRLAARLQLSRRAVEHLEAERAALETLLVRISSLLAELDPERLAGGVTSAVRQLTGARFALYEPAGDDPDAPRYTSPPTDGFAEAPRVDLLPLIALAVRRGRTLRVDDTRRRAGGEITTRAYGVLGDGRPVRSWLTAPVGDPSSTVIGAIHLGHHRAHAFSAHHEELVGALAAQLGTALSRATLVARRWRAAGVLEESLLPEVLPRIAGIDLAARYRATGAQSVGGDFYDAFELAGGACLVLGDVSGSGPEAAALTGLARSTVRAVAGDAQRPSEILHRVNEVMLRWASAERFITAVCLRLVVEGRGVTAMLSSGGHPPPLLVRGGGDTEVLDAAAGTLLGLFPAVSLVDQQRSLAPGDYLVLMTDGVLEARDPKGEEFGLDRLVDVTRAGVGRSAGGMAQRIERAVLDHRGERCDDDLAVVVVRAEP